MAIGEVYSFGGELRVATKEDALKEIEKLIEDIGLKHTLTIKFIQYDGYFEIDYKILNSWSRRIIKKVNP